MIGQILPGRPRKGDRVRYSVYDENLHGLTRVGTVLECTGEAGKVQREDGNGHDIVPMVCMTIFADPIDLLNQTIDTLKLIASQDQGCGGTATPERCWVGARQLAKDQLAVFGIRV